MDPLVARIRRTMRRHFLAPAGSRLLVALSGGADSMVLLSALLELEQAGECRVAGLAHLDHGIRGEAAREDEAFCRQVADRLALPFDCERVDVRALAAGHGWSLEAAGHTARYDFLERAAGRLGATRVALGHTRDDQAETFLLRLLRGAGPRGLASMHPRIGIFIRPMLDCSRRQVRAFASAHAVVFREDATNADLTIPRNRVRHELIPSLARVSPGIVRVLGRAATIARDDAQFLGEIAEAAFARIVSVSSQEIRVDAAQLRSEPSAISRRVAVLAISRLSGGRFIAFEHAERLLDLVHDPQSGPRHAFLPGQIATRTGDVVVLRAEKDGVDLNPAGTNFRFLLSIPGEIVSPAGWTLSAERFAWPPGTQDCSGSDFSRETASRVVSSDAGEGLVDHRSCAVLDAGGVPGPLVVRSWVPGDRVRPLGMTGTRKLQDLFVDRKVPRSQRSCVPVVADAANRIVWVAGHVIAEDFRVTRATSDVVILKLKYWRYGT